MAKTKLGFVETIRQNSQNVPSLEYLLGTSLMQPFSNTNAGAKSGQPIQ